MDNRDRKDDVRDNEERELDSPLGISGQPVPKDPADRVRAGSDEAEVRRRRERGIGAENDDQGTGMGDVNRDHKGATGIDMGAGGHNTQVSDRGTK